MTLNQHKKSLKKSALDWANRIRKIDGKPKLKNLPKGKRGLVTKCTLSEATGYHVGGIYKRPPIKITPSVDEFVFRFDNGEYPELIKEGSK